MKTISLCFSYLLILLLAVSCSSSDASITRVKREGEPAVELVSSDDPVMLLAIKESKRHFPEFVAALLDEDSLNYNFAVKVPFPMPDGNLEHIWLTEISIKDDSLYGVVSNEPLHTKQVVLGQTVSFTSNEITDWNYTKAGKLVGGYTIRVLMSKMTPEEQKEVETSLGAEID